MESNNQHQVNNQEVNNQEVNNQHQVNNQAEHQSNNKRRRNRGRKHNKQVNIQAIPFGHVQDNKIIIDEEEELNQDFKKLDKELYKFAIILSNLEEFETLDCPLFNNEMANSEFLNFGIKCLKNSNEIFGNITDLLNK